MVTKRKKEKGRSRVPDKKPRAPSAGTDGGGEGGTSGNWGGGADRGQAEPGEIPEGKAMIDPRYLRRDT